MNDLISRQALRSEMYHEAFEKDSNEQRWDSGCWIRYKMFERVVDRLPSAQRTGRWIPQDLNKKENGKTTLVWYAPKCSECGYPGNYPATWNFCPNCGAKMAVEE